jgi:DNA modification methylase
MKSTILVGDVLTRLAELPNGSVRTCVTSPPYWGLRDYGQDDQLGLEPTPEAYVENMVKVFREVWRVLADDGTLWLNLGDSYGEKKQLVGIPWRVAFALQADGWYLRQDIIWAKPNPMPESVRDRCTKSHEYVFLLSKSPRYYYDYEAIKEPAKWERWGNQTENKKHSGTARHLGGKTIDELPISDKKNKRDVWTIATKPFKGAHFAVMPEALVEPCVLAGSAVGDTILDPFTGSGTVAVIALRYGRNFVGTELNPEYARIAEERITKAGGMFVETELT